MRVPTLALTAVLLACAAPVGASARRDAPARVGPYALEVVAESGESLPTFEHRGRTYVLGTLGQRYLLRVRNRSERRIEVVASVDGRDVIDGRPATLDKRGYVVDAWSDVTIDGFRLHGDAVAAFRFSSVAGSYAARMGDARDVGVIGVAVFPERPPRRDPPAYRPEAPSHPAPFPERAEAGPDARGRDAAPVPKAPGKAAPGSGAAGAPSPAPDGHASRRPGLGTEFGEAHASRVETTPFERARSRPETILTVRYDDRQGLLALGIDVDGRRSERDEAWLRATATPFRGRPGFSEPPPGWCR